MSSLYLLATMLEKPEREQTVQWGLQGGRSELWVQLTPGPPCLGFLWLLVFLLIIISFILLHCSNFLVMKAGVNKYQWDPINSV